MFYNVNIDKNLTKIRLIYIYAMVFAHVLNEILSHANFKEIANF